MTDKKLSAAATRKIKKAEARAASVQTVAHKPGDVISFSVAGSDIKYLFRVLDLAQRADYRRDIRASRGIPPTKQEVNAILREGIDLYFSGTEAEKMHAVVDEVDAFEITAAQQVNSGQLAEAQATAKRIQNAYVGVSYKVRRVHALLAEMDGDMQFARDVNNLVVLKHTLVGWEDYNGPDGAPVSFATDASGKPTQATIAAIPQEHFFHVANRAYDFVRLGQATIKN